VRRMFQAVGHPVQRLRRLGYGGVHLGGLPVGHVRPLNAHEIASLCESAGTELKRPRAGKRESP
jgi:23S rRNA pseudouridine2605 synthase